MELNDYALHRFWSKVKTGPGKECWSWEGGKSKGRGKLFVSGKDYLATHVALEAVNRPRLGTAFACHTCDNPACVNPAHLWWGDNSENMKDCSEKGRHFQSSKTHCPHGHEYTAGNIIRMPWGARQCRVCRNKHVKNWRERQKTKRQEDGLSPHTLPNL